MSVGDVQPEKTTAGGLARLWPGALLFLLAVIAGLAMLRDGALDLWYAWQTPEYSHGPLIPVISGYLFLRQMKHVPHHEGPVTDRWPGFLVLMLALAMGIFGSVTMIQKVTSMAIIVWVFGLILVSFGWRRGRHFWPPVVHLSFMLPLPFFLYWQVSLALQLISSELGVAVISAFGVPVYLDGNVIDLGVYKLQVAEACSGLRYLYPIFSFTYVFSVLYQGSIWHKGFLLLAAAPLTVALNAFRIGMIGVLVDWRGIEMAEGFLHLFEGWVIFLSLIVIMIGLAKALQRLSGDRRPLSEVLDIDLSGLGAQIARVGEIRPSRPLIAAIAAFSVAAVVWSPLAQPEAPKFDREPFVLFPQKFNGWNVVRNWDIDPGIGDILRADDYLYSAIWAPGQPVSVDVFIAYYANQAAASIHSPEVCIPAGGWEMSDIEVTETTVPVEGGDLTIPLNRAVIQNGLNKQLVYYWFDQGGRRSASDIETKLFMLMDSFRTGRRDGALVRFTTQIGAGEPVEAADNRLKAAISAVTPYLPRFINTDLTLPE